MRWSKIEDNIVIRLYNKHGWKGIISKLPHRTKNSIVLRAGKLGVAKSDFYTKKDEQFLIRNYKKHGSLYCIKKLKRSIYSVINKASKLGLRTDYKFKRKAENKLYSGYMDISGTLFNRTKRNAIKRNLCFSLNIKYLWKLFLKQDKKCAISGLDLYFSDRSSDYNGTASLDRINSSFGYKKGNVQWVHKNVNMMKQNMSDREFINICKIITEKNCHG